LGASTQAQISVDYTITMSGFDLRQGQLLTEIENWPQWWRAVKRVELLQAGDADGLGAAHRMTWKTALPYQLTFDMRMTRVEPMSVLEGRASGELDGVGLWTLRPEGEGTHVRYNWNVVLTRPWMRALAPLLRSVFTWNHNVVMAWGYEDIRTRLAAGR
jgi:Polyketide cyclase / dehydrase and lipid transport